MQTHTLNNQALRKLIALLGVDATEALLEEFGGTTVYFPSLEGSPRIKGLLEHERHRANPQRKANDCRAERERLPYRLVLHIEMHPMAAMKSAASALSVTINQLHEYGVHVRTIGVVRHDYADDVFDALRNELTISADVVKLL